MSQEQLLGDLMELLFEGAGLRVGDLRLELGQRGHAVPVREIATLLASLTAAGWVALGRSGWYRITPQGVAAYERTQSQGGILSPLTVAVLAVLDADGVLPLEGVRAAIWRFTHADAARDAVRERLTVLMAAGWVVRNHTWYRLTDAGRQVYRAHMGAQAVPA